MHWIYLKRNLHIRNRRISWINPEYISKEPVPLYLLCILVPPFKVTLQSRNVKRLAWKIFSWVIFLTRWSKFRILLIEWALEFVFSILIDLSIWITIAVVYNAGCSPCSLIYIIASVVIGIVYNDYAAPFKTFLISIINALSVLLTREWCGVTIIIGSILALILALTFLS